MFVLRAVVSHTLISVRGPRDPIMLVPDDLCIGSHFQFRVSKICQWGFNFQWLLTYLWNPTLVVFSPVRICILYASVEMYFEFLF